MAVLKVRIETKDEEEEKKEFVFETLGDALNAERALKWASEFSDAFFKSVVL